MLGASIVASVLDSWWVLTGVIAAILAILESLRRMAVGLWRTTRALVRFADALPALLRLADQADSLATTVDLHEHMQEDATFQQLIIRRLDQMAPQGTEATE